MTTTSDYLFVPLMTPFIAPKSCQNTSHMDKIISLARTSELLIQGPSVSAKECFPSGWKNTPDFYFSPARNCPTNYNSASYWTEKIGTAIESRVICCPDGYLYFVGINPMFPCRNAFQTAPAVSTTDNSTLSVVFANINAPSLQLRYQSTDVARFNGSSGLNPNKLSQTAINGIIVGAILGVLFLTIPLMILCLRKARKSRRAQQLAIEQRQNGSLQIVQKEGLPYGWKAELNGHDRGRRHPGAIQIASNQELEGSRVTRVELPT